jgi:hypothetical protein
LIAARGEREIHTWERLDQAALVSLCDAGSADEYV